MNDPDIKVESLIMGVGPPGSTDKLMLKFYLFQVSQLLMVLGRDAET